MCICMLKVLLFSCEQSTGVNYLHASFLSSSHTHAHTHTKPVGVEENVWHVLAAVPTQPRLRPTHLCTARKTHPENWFFSFPLLSFEKFTLVLKPILKHTHTLSLSAETCPPENTNLPQLLHTQLLQHLNTEEEEASLTESSGCFPHAFIMSSSKTTNHWNCSIPCCVVGSLLSLLYRFQKTLAMTWQHFMTVYFPPGKAQG